MRETLLPLPVVGDGDVLSTTYDKIELSDYKDVLNRGD